MSQSSETEYPVDKNASELAEKILVLQSKLINLKIFIAVPMGILMILYFFTFAMFIDHGLSGALYFELFSSVAFVFAFIYLNQLGFWLLKKRFAKHRVYGQILQRLDMNSIAEDAQHTAERLNA